MTVATSQPYSLSPGKRIWAPIAAGPLAGRRWMPRSGGKILRLFLGTYEKPQSDLFLELIQPGDTLYDVGAACGYYSLLGAKLVGDSGMVVAFEPDPVNAAFTRAHLGTNRCTNSEVFETAVGNGEGTARFGRGTGTGTGSLSGDGEFEVPITTIDRVVADIKRPPTHMKIDVEGAEVDVLAGAEQTIAQYRPTLFLSVHSERLHEACCQRMSDWGYTLSPIEGDSIDTSFEILCRP